MTTSFMDNAGVRPGSDLVLVGGLGFAHGLIGADLQNPKRALAESVEAQTRQLVGATGLYRDALVSMDVVVARRIP